MKIWELDEACAELNMARRTFQYHMKRNGVEKVGGRFLITDEVMEMMRNIDRTPGRKKVKKS